MTGPAPRLVGATLAVATALLATSDAAGRRRGGARVAVTASPPQLVLEPDASAAVTARPAAGPIRWSASIGTIDGARYRPGDRRAPAFAIVAAALVVADGRELRGATVVPLVAPGVLPTKTTPGAQVSVVVAGRTFGPITADARGRAGVPVEVPPGVTSATVTAVDRKGRRTVRQLALPVAPFPTAVAIGPRVVRAGEETTISVFVLTPQGAWRRGGSPPEARLTDGTSLRLGTPRPAGIGRWEIPAVGLAAGGASRVAVTVDGEPAGEVTIPVVGAEAAPPPPVVAPPTRQRPRGPTYGGAASVRVLAGGATNFGALASAIGALDLHVLVRTRGQAGVALGVEVAWASGRSDFLPADQRVEQVTGSAAIWVRAPLVPPLRYELGFGGGVGRGRHPAGGTDTAPLFYTAAAVAYPFGPAAALLELRYDHVRYDGAVGLEGNALGLGLRAGLALEF